ncbi:MAG: M24 family metallopeptidase [Actinomycetota bacterium]|nr:Xaa-Pro peptidase family protein [Actinomycetota bacterium]
MPDFERRIVAVRAALAGSGGAGLLVGPGADLRYLTGYDALPLERLTLLVVPPTGDPLLIVPALERPRAESQGVSVPIAGWRETDDPFALVPKAVGPAKGTVFVGDRLWAAFVLRLQRELHGLPFGLASSITGPLRIRKDPAEISLLRDAASVADDVALALADERVAGWTERELSRWISDRLIAGGVEHVNFALVAAGENAASPHHEPGDRVIAPGESIVCDFGGTIGGYCSDITRTYVVGPAPDDLREVHGVVLRAQAAGTNAARPGVPCESVDAAARTVIESAGFGEAFMHRTGHGIGLEEHEDPYIVGGNSAVLEPGMAFSVEPGVYVRGRLGVRIEDIVVCNPSGPESLNTAPRDLVELPR